MKHLMFWIAVVFLVVTCFLIFKKRQESLDPIEKMTTIRIDNSLMDIGDREIKKSAVGKYKIYNTGTNDLIIKSLEPECHCTVGEFTNRPIRPGDSTTIILRYDSTRLGGFQSTARLETNSQQTPVLIVLRGNMTTSNLPK